MDLRRTRRNYERRTAWDRRVFKHFAGVTSGLSSQRSGERVWIRTKNVQMRQCDTPPPPKQIRVRTRGKSHRQFFIFQDFPKRLLWRKTTYDTTHRSLECEGLSEASESHQSAIGQRPGGCSVHRAITPHVVHDGQPTPRALCETRSAHQVRLGATRAMDRGAYREACGTTGSVRE